MFRAQKDGYALWKAFAAKTGRAAQWREWSADEPCAQRAVAEDVASSSWTPRGEWCQDLSPPVVDMGGAPEVDAGKGAEVDGGAPIDYGSMIDGGLAPDLGSHSRPQGNAYSASSVPDPPISFGRSFCFGKPSWTRTTASP